MQSFAAAHINHVRIRRGYGDTTHRAGWLVCKNWIPGAAIVSRLEDSAIDLRHIKNVWLRRHACHRARSPATEWTNVAPVKRLQKVLTHLAHGARTYRHKRRR